MNDLSKACLDEAKNNMQGAIKHLEAELTKIRAGKANPAMLDGIKVDYYRTPTLISQIANISTPDPRNITIQPWEKNMMGAISKAIQAANLGFNPQQEADMLRIIIPPLTEERRKELAKQCKGEAETAKVSVRNARRDTIDALKKAVKDGLAEDAQKGGEEKLQKLHDKYIKQIDDMYAAKEKEIMTV